MLSEDPGAASLKEVMGRAGKTIASAPADAVRQVAIAIGPEGGWTQDELEFARGAQFSLASLGQTILRTETAVAAAIASVNYALGE